MERSNEDIALSQTLAKPLLDLQNAARHIADVSAECGLPMEDVEEYITKFRPSLMDVTYAWSKGANFKDVSSGSSVMPPAFLKGKRRRAGCACYCWSSGVGWGWLPVIAVH